jgi:hypothetical protein
MRVNIRAGDRLVTGTLNDSAAARELAALLPLKLTLSDYASTEKISDLPKRLCADGAPAGHYPSAGDIAYYSPWGNLAIFYRSFRYSAGLVLLGRIDEGLDVLSAHRSVQVTIERADRTKPDLR